MESRNDKLIKARIFIDKIGNKIEDEEIINLLFIPAKSYNADDTYVTFSNGVYFIFNYPEFDNLIKKEENPYNRENLEYKYVSALSFYHSLKKDLIKECRVRGLQVELKGTMEENLEEVFENIKRFKPQEYLNNTNTLLNLVFRHFNQDFSS